MGGEPGKSHRIYRERPAVSDRPRLPRSAEPRPAAPAPVAAEPPTLEARILAVLDAPLPPGETIEVGYRNKEQLLLVLFAELRAAEALALHRRLLAPAVGDALAIRFGRMASERRIRLLAFLADVRRREARAGRR